MLARRLRMRGIARVALERPNGLVVDRLLDAGIAVMPVHPNQLAAARDRHRSGGGKSDGFDAYVLAELVRDVHRLRVLESDGDETQALTCARDDLVNSRVALANQFRDQLYAFWHGAAGLFADIDSPIALAFLERCSDPDDALLLGAKRLHGFLACDGYSGRRNAGALLRRLRKAPTGRIGEFVTETRCTIVLALVASLRPTVEQIKLLTSQITGALDEHSGGLNFRYRKSIVTAAELIVEIGDRRSRRDPRVRLEARAGQSPVTIESGKQKVASFCGARSGTLRDAISVLADGSRKHNP